MHEIVRGMLIQAVVATHAKMGEEGNTGPNSWDLYITNFNI